MLQNFRRFFRFYLALFLFGLLLLGVHWQGAPLGVHAAGSATPVVHTVGHAPGARHLGAVATR